MPKQTEDPLADVDILPVTNAQYVTVLANIVNEQIQNTLNQRGVKEDSYAALALFLYQLLAPRRDRPLVLSILRITIENLASDPAPTPAADPAP